MKLTRRSFIKGSMASFGTVVISTGLAGCISDNTDEGLPAPVPMEVSPADFLHGIASGDPTPSGIILWTRATPRDTAANAVPVSWQVATDTAFTNLVRSGAAAVTAPRDYILKVDVQGLNPGTRYFYRFMSGDTRSVTGTFKTLPTSAVEQVKLAVFSCSNYPAGYFHVYAEAAKRDDLDAVIHLGDYIYEYPNGGYATEDADALGRTIPANNDVETVSLNDYRRRYALYRTDSDLQALHQNTPFITVWDDHEITNDAYIDGAQNHDDSEGDYEVRKQAALQAYFEWMPIRPVATNDQETIYRRFDFGQLVSLYMLDTRIIGRDKQLSLTDYVTATGIDGARFVADVTDPNRSLLGSRQLTWLQDQFTSSNSTWQVLGQQVLMGRMFLPAEIMVVLGQLEALVNAGQDTSALIAQANVLFAQLATIKARVLAGDPTVTAAERARVETVIPYNLDAWDGYAFEREQVLGAAAVFNKNLVVLAGDTHNAWANNLMTDAANPVAPARAVGVEFATASVSSPGLEAFFGLANVPSAVAEQFEGVIQLLVDGLQYTNLVQRGYMVVTFTQERAIADWHYVDTIKDQSYRDLTERQRQLSVLAGEKRLHMG